MTAEFVSFVSQLPNALALAGAFLVAGFLVTRIAFDKNPVARFLAQLASFAGFTIMLFAAGALPSEATPKGDPNFEYLAISVFKIVWWLAAAWLSAGFFCAVLVFKGQPRGTRFPGDLVVGAVYVTAVLAIVADVFDMPVGGLRRYRHCARPRASEPRAASFQASCSISPSLIVPAPTEAPIALSASERGSKGEFRAGDGAEQTQDSPRMDRSA
jgi:hypothetical protein